MSMRHVRLRVVEAALSEPTGKRWRIRIIEAGWSDNGLYYPREVLAESARAFEGARVYAYDYKPGAKADGLDHLPRRLREAGVRPGEFARNLVGVLTGVVSESDGLHAVLDVLPSGEWLARDALAARERGLPDPFGFSIDSVVSVRDGVAPDGRSGPIVAAVREVLSVDAVSHPAAGGRLERVAASSSDEGQKNKSGGAGARRADDNAAGRAAAGGRSRVMTLEELLAGCRDRGLIDKIDASWTPDQQRSAFGRALRAAESRLWGALAGRKLDARRVVENKDVLGNLVSMLEAGDLAGALGLAKDWFAKYDEMQAAMQAEEAKPPSPPPAVAAPAAESRGGANGCGAAAPGGAEIKGVLDEVKREREELRRERSTALVARLVESSGLPAIARERVSALFSGRGDATEALVREAVDKERKYLDAVSGAGNVFGLGAPRASVGVEKPERLQAALDGMLMGRDVGTDFRRDHHDVENVPELALESNSKFRGARYPRWRAPGFEGEVVPRFRSLKQAFAAFTGMPADTDPEIMVAESRGYVPLYHPKREVLVKLARESRHQRLVAMGETRLAQESLTVALFAQALGDSVARRMQVKWKEDDLQKWRWSVSAISDIKDFRTQRRVRIGEYDDLAIVAEQATYPQLTSPGDEEATFAIAKRGGVDDLTIEMFANDDIGALRAIPDGLARSAIRTLYKFVMDFMRTNPNVSYEAVALAAAGHNNLLAAPLSKATADQARQLMREQTSFGVNAADFPNLVPAFLHVPPELEDIAFRLATSEVLVGAAGTNEPNLHRGIRYVVHGYWADADNYWFHADPEKGPILEVGFYQGREEPELFTQDDPTVGSAFTADKVTYKIRTIFGGGILDHRGFVGGIV